MGLQRKQGEIIQEGQQFDIRSSVDEFKHYTSSYMFWKPGMEIFVSHVRRRQIPPFVFPEGHRRSRATRLSALQRSDGPNQDDVQNGRSGSNERYLKRKNDLDRIEGEHDSPQKRQSISPRRQDSVSSNVSNFSNIASPECPEADVEAKTIDEKDSSCQTITRENEELTFGGSSIGSSYSRKESRSVESDKGSLNFEPDKVPFTEIDQRCASNSSVITTLTSESSSCENGGSALAAGNSEGNAGSIEGSADESNNPGTSVVDSCEADSELQLDNNCVNGDSMHMETEVWAFIPFVGYIWCYSWSFSLLPYMFSFYSGLTCEAKCCA